MRLRSQPVLFDQLCGSRPTDRYSQPFDPDVALVLHTGDATEWLAPGILAAPWWKVL